MRRLLLSVLGVILFGALTAPVSAWEFGVTGSTYWTYEFYHQMGNQGFFGPYNIDNDGVTSTANLNFWWNGPRLSQNMVTGSTARKSYLYVIMDPTLKINRAVRLDGRLRLGQFGNPNASYYDTQDSPGISNSMSEAQWTLFWCSVSLPWGTFEIGKRPWTFGTGLQYDGTDALTTESAMLNAPYGPFDIGFGFYPQRPAQSQYFPIDPYAVDNNPLSISFSSIFGPAMPAVQPYFNPVDAAAGLRIDVVGYWVYHNGPLQIGMLGSYGAYHRGPEGPLQFTSFPAGVPVPGAAVPVAQDSDFFHGTVFSKYNDGRFFFNAEAAWVYWTDRLSGSALLPGGAVSGPARRYTEQWRYMAETGCMSGNSKLSLLAAWSPGPDRRNGALIDRQQALFVWHPQMDLFLGNYDVFRPYSFILGYNYGSGMNAYDLSLYGYMRDAWVLAGRVDYAVAANLNVYGTFLWAERTTTGYGWGCIFPNFPIFPDGNVAFRINGPINAGLAGPAPNIPDRSLGWECNAGVDWQLLDGFTIGFLGAYWQPGKWSTYACVDRSIPAWLTTPTSANNWGTRPTKSIDPIVGGQFTMTYSF